MSSELQQTENREENQVADKRRSPYRLHVIGSCLSCQLVKQRVFASFRSRLCRRWTRFPRPQNARLGGWFVWFAKKKKGGSAVRSRPFVRFECGAIP